MKRTVLTASILCGTILFSAAQQRSTISLRDRGQTTVGIHAGVNGFTINGKNSGGVELDNKLNTGFEAGLDVAIPLGGRSFLQPGIDFRQKGTEDVNGIKTTLQYIDIPVNYVYKPVVGTGNLLLGFGPYIGFGVGGKVKSPNGATSDVLYRDKFDRSVSSSNVQLRRTDAGANFLVGYQFLNNLAIRLNAQLGLKDINPDMSNEGNNNQTRYRNTGFGLSLGYRF